MSCVPCCEVCREVWECSRERRPLVFLHMPLYRPSDDKCGRERGGVEEGSGGARRWEGWGAEADDAVDSCYARGGRGGGGTL